MNERRDNIAEFIKDIEQRESQTRGKVRQTWRGLVAVDYQPGTDVNELLNERSPKSYTFGLVQATKNWAILESTYTVKGANANDLDKNVTKWLGIKEGDVAVYTESVTPIGDVQ